MKIIYIAVAVLCLIATITFGVNWCSLLFALAGICSLTAFVAKIKKPPKSKKSKKSKKKDISLPTIAFLLSLALCIGGFLTIPNSTSSFDLNNIPDYSGSPYVVINNNKPNFSENEITTTAYEKYAELDFWGRCGVAQACCGKELMPADGEERESINNIIPSGWVQAEYDFISGGYLYNRCHLIGWQLTAENANEKNLITGTKYLNIEGMLPFENMISDYIKETGNHVMYRVTPIYHSNDLLPKGVQMEGYSVEDNGNGISFNVYCYNVQPGVTIDYATGRSCKAGETISQDLMETVPVETTYNGTYVLNTSSKKIHTSDCSNAAKISADNRKEVSGDLSEFFNEGYTYCGICLKDATAPVSSTELNPNTTSESSYETDGNTPSSTSVDTGKEPQSETPITTDSNTQVETTAEPEVSTTPETPTETTPAVSYVLNTNSKKIHYPDCRYAKQISETNRQEYTGDISELLEEGYATCKTCFK